MESENRYLVKIAKMLKQPEPPRSERAFRRPKKIKKPKLRRFGVHLHPLK